MTSFGTGDYAGFGFSSALGAMEMAVGAAATMKNAISSSINESREKKVISNKTAARLYKSFTSAMDQMQTQLFDAFETLNNHPHQYAQLTVDAKSTAAGYRKKKNAAEAEPELRKWPYNADLVCAYLDSVAASGSAPAASWIREYNNPDYEVWAASRFPSVAQNVIKGLGLFKKFTPDLLYPDAQKYGFIDQNNLPVHASTYAFSNEQLNICGAQLYNELTSAYGGDPINLSVVSADTLNNRQKHTIYLANLQKAREVLKKYGVITDDNFTLSPWISLMDQFDILSNVLYIYRKAKRDKESKKELSSTCIVDYLYHIDSGHLSQVTVVANAEGLTVDEAKDALEYEDQVNDVPGYTDPRAYMSSEKLNAMAKQINSMSIPDAFRAAILQRITGRAQAIQTCNADLSSYIAKTIQELCHQGVQQYNMQSRFLFPDDPNYTKVLDIIKAESPSHPEWNFLSNPEAVFHPVAIYSPRGFDDKAMRDHTKFLSLLTVLMPTGIWETQTGALHPYAITKVKMKGLISKSMRITCTEMDPSLNVEVENTFDTPVFGESDVTFFNTVLFPRLSSNTLS